MEQGGADVADSNSVWNFLEFCQSRLAKCMDRSPGSGKDQLPDNTSLGCLEGSAALKIPRSGVDVGETAARDRGWDLLLQRLV